MARQSCTMKRTVSRGHICHIFESGQKPRDVLHHHSTVDAVHTYAAGKGRTTYDTTMVSAPYFSYRRPPLDGSLYFPDMITFNAMHNPTHPMYTFYDARADVLRDISHLVFYRACQRIAHAVRRHGGPDRAVVAIIVQCDTVLYHALTMGVVFAGLIPFPISPRNSPAAIVNMLQKTKCSRVLATRHAFATLLDGILEAWTTCAGQQPLEIEEPPTLADAYPELGAETAGTPFVPCPETDRRPAPDDIMYYLHSSGSTGFPKPIPITFMTAVHWCLTPSVLEQAQGLTDIQIGAASLPPFHGIGIYAQLVYPVASLVRVSMYAPTSYHEPLSMPVVPSAGNTLDVVLRTGANALFVVPAFLEAWAGSPEAVRILRGLEYVVFAGGPLATKTGDALTAAGIKLSSVYGATEVCAITCTFKDRPEEWALWEWVRFGPNQQLRWVDQGDGTYECQVLTCPTHHVSVENLPDVRGYATADAFVKHPTIEGLYKHIGRLDDVLVHASGEKTVPAPMEMVIGSNKHLAGVCMFGRGRNQTGVLVEPRAEYAIDVENEVQVAAFRNVIWPDVQEANKEAPAFSRIFKEMILVTRKEKPMLRTGKGTVMKKATMTLYEPEMDALYAAVEASAKSGIDVPLPESWSQEEVEGWLIVHATAVHAGKPVYVNIDVFEQGFDSLSSTFLKNRIVGSLRASSHEAIREAASRISQDIVFANPRLRQLASHLIRCVDVGAEVCPLAAPDPKGDIEAMIAKYTAGLGDGLRVGDDKQETCHHGHVVLLTGSTGGLGSHLLASLLNREDVAVVYAFNRSSKVTTIQQRQRVAFEDRGLNTALLDAEKLVYVEGDASRPNLLLDDSTYAEIRDAVTVIIHTGWRVDFNLALSSFESQVQGTRHLIDLARTSRWTTKPRFLFTSSISSAQGWDRSIMFPEEVQYDAGVAVGPGYGGSKYVSERILAMSGLPATSFRIGQITGGAPRGAWSTSNWIPIIVKSSVHLGALPDARGVASWLPPHAVCDAILDVGFADEAPPPAVNLVHPRPVAWRCLMQLMGEMLYQKHLTASVLGLIPFNQWVMRLDAWAHASNSEADMKRVPAIKLLDFMRRLAETDEGSLEEGSEALGFVRCDTEVAERVSQTMHTLESLSGNDVAQWVDYWVSVGMFTEGLGGANLDGFGQGHEASMCPRYE